MKDMTMKTTTLTLFVTLLSLPAFAAETREGMHQMPDGSWMANHEMVAKTESKPIQAERRIVASVNGLVCDFCAQAIKKTLMKEPGVTDVQVDLTAKSVVVGLKADAMPIEKERLGKLLLDAGYDMTGYKVE